MLGLSEQKGKGTAAKETKADSRSGGQPKPLPCSAGGGGEGCGGRRSRGEARTADLAVKMGILSEELVCRQREPLQQSPNATLFLSSQLHL